MGGEGDAYLTSFCGRGVELDTIEALLAEAAEGAGRSALVEGEAGIGKSRLLGEARMRAVRAGFQVFHTRAEEMERHRPFATIADCLRIRGSGERPRTPGATFPLGGPDDAGPGLPAAPFGTDFRVVEALMSRVDERCAQRPTALLIDDLQWADPASLVVLHRLIRAAADLPLLLLCSTRPLPRPPELEQLVRTVDAGRLVRMPLPPLSETESVALVGELLDAQVGPGLRRQILGAGGNPLFLIELIAIFERAEVIQRDADGAAEVASGARLVPSLPVTILQRLSFLSPGALELLRVASVLGSSFTVNDLSAVMGRPVAGLLGALDELARGGILGEHGPRLAFRHDLLREVLYQDLPLAVRMGLHLDTARALAASGAPPAQVAAHFSLGAAPGDSQALEWLRRAAEDAAARAPSVAAELLERAVALCPPGHPQRDHLLADRALNLFLAGRVAESERICDEVLCRDHDAGAEGALRLCMARILTVRGEMDRALGQFDLALRAVPEGGVEHARVMALHTVGRLVGGGLPRPEETVAALIQTAEESGDEKAACIALSCEALLLSRVGRPAEALEVAEESVRRADRSPNRLAHHFPLTLTVGICLTELDRFAEAQAAYARGRRIGGELGATWSLCLYHWSSAVARFLSGEWDDADREVSAGFEAAEETGIRQAAASGHSVRALIALHRNDLRRAQAEVELGEREIDGSGPGLRASWPLWARGLVEEALGRLDAARDSLEAAWARCAPSASEASSLGPDVVRVAAKAGDRQLAERTCAAVERLAALEGRPSLEGAALRCRGLLEDDADALVRAVQSLRHAPRPRDRALACEDAADALARAGRVEEARQLLDEAVSTFDGLGATRDAARAEARLRAHGVHRGRRGSRKRPKTGWESLTPMERRVVELVAEGLSNPQIAERMYLSRRTVQTHVSHALAKVGARSRTELVVQVARRELTPTTAT